MQIHVIQRGDSLVSIANTYVVEPDDIIHANELHRPNELVVGQTLVIPLLGQFYVVQQNDTVSSTAAPFGITVEQLAAINQIPVDAALQDGMRLYMPAREKRDITT